MELGDLVQSVYLSITQAEAAERLPAQIAEWTNGSTVALWTVDGELTPLDRVLTNSATELSVLYAEHYHRHDPYRARFFTDCTGAVVLGSSIASDRELERSVYYNEFARHFDLFHMRNTCFALPAEQGWQFGSLSVLRPRHFAAFEEKEMKRLSAIVPHLKAAAVLRIQVAARLADMREQTAVSLLEALPTPACLLTAAGKVIYANASAERLDLQRTGLLLGGRAVERRITVPSVREAAALATAIAVAATGGPGSTLRLNLADGSSHLASVSPVALAMPIGIAAPRQLAMLVLRPLASSADAVADLGRKLFGLTEAEAATAAALTLGAAPKMIARQRGVAVSTVRTLLERAQFKVGAANIRQLAATLGVLGSG